MNKLKTQYIDLSKKEIIDEIKKFLNEQIDLVTRELQDDEAFSKAAWPYYQAKKLGQQKAYIKLLSYLPENIND